MNKAIIVIAKKNGPYLCTCACCIAIEYRIIQAIAEHVIAEEALAGGDEGIGIDESAPLGIVITALEVIEP